MKVSDLRRLKADKESHSCELPRTADELEAELLASVERLDRGEGVDGREVLRRLHKKFGKSSAPG